MSNLIMMIIFNFRGLSMTREDIEQLNVVEPYCFESDKEELWYNVGLKNGLEIADENPKSPWISVKDDLPCNHEELMEPICQLDNRLIYETKRVFVHCSNNSLDTAHMINFYNRWKWYPEDIDVEHWFPIPKLPKE